MPLVLVTANRTRFPSLTDAYLRPIGELITTWVANILTCDDPGGKLTPNDIEVRFQDRSLLDVGGDQHALEVIVFANDFPSRRQNLDERCRQLQDYFKAALMPDLHGYVWIRLAPAAFVEF
jgi:hypothetical protein